MIGAIVHCDLSARLLSDARERRLSLGERVPLALHLVLCAKCRRYRRQLHRLAVLCADFDRQGLAQAGDDHAVRTRIRDGLRRRLGESSGAWRR